jgi:hypothetical protein
MADAAYSPTQTHPDFAEPRPAPPTGADLRDLFALAALGGCQPNCSTSSDVADWCYQVADAMLARRARQ